MTIPQVQPTVPAIKAADKLTELVLALPESVATVQVLRIIVQAEQIGFDRGQREAAAAALANIRLSS